MSKDYSGGLPDLGEQVAGWRRLLGMTQAELEAKAGLSHNALSRIETGQVSPRLATLERIAAAMKLSVDELQCRRPVAQTVGDGDPGDWYAVAARVEALNEEKRALLLKTVHQIMDLMEKP